MNCKTSVILIIIFNLAINNKLLSINISADSTTTPKRIIKIELFVNGIEYEHEILNKQSIMFGLNYNIRKHLIPEDHTFHATLAYRVSLLQYKNWPSTLFVGCYINYKDYIWKSESSNINSINNLRLFGAGIQSGANLVVFKRIIINSYIGFGYNLFRDVIVEQGVALKNKDNFNFHGIGGLTIGYLF